MVQQTMISINILLFGMLLKCVQKLTCCGAKTKTEIRDYRTLTLLTVSFSITLCHCDPAVCVLFAQCVLKVIFPFTDTQYPDGQCVCVLKLVHQLLN